MPAGPTLLPPPTAATGADTPKPDTVATIINNTAHRWNVPAPLLWGVFGLESGWGKTGNWFGLVSVPRSSYGVDAQGRRYAASGPTFSGDADIAAKTLAHFYSTNHNWDQTLSIYNSGKPVGGYTTKKILEVANSRGEFLKHDYTPGGLTGAVQDLATGPAGDAAAAVVDAASAPLAFLKLLTSLEFWLRLGEGIAGLVLIAMGLKVLTGVQVPTPVGRV